MLGRAVLGRAPVLTAVLAAVIVALPELAAAGGRLDQTFNGDGKVRTEFHSNEDWANDVAVLPNGKTVAVGIAAPGGEIYDGTGDAVFAVAVYRRDGRLDRTFSNDGRRNINFHPDPNGKLFDYEEATSVAVQADGKIVVVGQVSRPGFLTSQIALARLTPSGRLDPAFGDDGKILSNAVCGGDNCLLERPERVLVQTDGKILVVGCHGCDPAGSELLLVRYRPNGRADPAFGDGGVVTTDVTPLVDYGVDGALRPRGAILALTATFEVVRYDSSGDIQRIFRVDPPELEYSESTSLAVDGSNRMVLAGAVWDRVSATDFVVVRVKPGGGLDDTFSRDGLVVTDVTADGAYCDVDRAMDVAIQADGKILAAGRTCSLPARGIDFGVVRYGQHGRRDTTFGKDGIVRTDFSGAEFANTSALRFGRLVVAGSRGHRVASGDRSARPRSYSRLLASMRIIASGIRRWELQGETHPSRSTGLRHGRTLPPFLTLAAVAVVTPAARGGVDGSSLESRTIIVEDELGEDDEVEFLFPPGTDAAEGKRRARDVALELALLIRSVDRDREPEVRSGVEIELDTILGRRTGFLERELDGDVLRRLDIFGRGRIVLDLHPGAKVTSADAHSLGGDLFMSRFAVSAPPHVSYRLPLTELVFPLLLLLALVGLPYPESNRRVQMLAPDRFR
jgi:uncharacterized delta-60 repeat protein